MRFLWSRHRWLWSYKKLVAPPRITLNAWQWQNIPDGPSQHNNAHFATSSWDSLSRHTRLTLKDTETSEKPSPNASPAPGAAKDNGEKPKLTTFQQWLHESDVKKSTGEARLIDRDTRSPPDFVWWIKLLEFRVRIDGHQGAWAIFEGLRTRDIDLPTEGRPADRLWSAIILASVELKKMQTLWSYIQDLYQRTGHRYYRLYEVVLGTYFSLDARMALEYHKQFKTIGLPAAGNLRSLILTAEMTPHTAAALRVIYTDYREAGIYDALIARLCAKRQFRDAVFWHFQLVRENDYPSSADVVRSLMNFLSLSGRLETLARVQQSLRHIISTTTLLSTETSLDRVRPKTQANLSAWSWVTPSRNLVSDEFCARAFATKAFTPSFVIRSLGAFGAQSIGPLSLREMGLRCRSLIKSFHAGEENPNQVLAREIVVQLDQLKASKIEVRPCKYTMLVSELSRNGQGDLLDAILSSDQHPDVYEDEEIQTRLLHSYIAAEDWRQVHRTLAVLTMAHQRLAWNGWNALLQSYMRPDLAMDHIKVFQILDLMRDLQVPLTVKTIRSSYFALARSRNPGKRPTRRKDSIADLQFLERMWLDALKSGLNIPASAWREILKRYGMLGMYPALERLCLWLTYFYSSKLAAPPNAAYRRRSAQQMNLIFPRLMQRAIAEWYFDSLRSAHAETCHALPAAASLIPNSNLSPYHPPQLFTVTHTYARGLALLRLLRRYGLHLDMRSIRAAVRHRLIVLYGEGISNRLKNRQARRKNPYALKEMASELLRVWGPLGAKQGALFTVSARSLLEGGGGGGGGEWEKMLRRAIFGEVKFVRTRQQDGSVRISRRYRRRLSSESRLKEAELPVVKQSREEISERYA